MHDDGITSFYGDLKSITLKVGDVQSQGVVIAKSGSSGNSTRPHLHLEIRNIGLRLDLRTYFPNVEEGVTVVSK